MKLADLDGYYSGRCFANNNPDHADNIMLGFYVRSIGENRGPAFPSPKPETKIMCAQADGAADYFDSDERAPQNKREFNDVIKKNWNRISGVNDAKTLSFSTDWEGDGRMDENHSIVRYKDYFIDTWSGLITQDYGGFGYHKAGDTLAMCYFFKKLN